MKIVVFTNIFSLIYIFLFILLFLVIYFLFIFIYKKIKIFKKLKYLKHKGKITKEKNYYLFDINNKRYYLFFLFAKRNSDIQINNKITWQCFYHNMLSSKYLNKIIPFMNLSKENKIVILLGNVKVVKLVINESEMIIVKQNTKVYDVNVILEKEIESFNW